jgi:thymidine kinase
MSIKGLIKDFPTEKYDDDYVIINKFLFEGFKEEYSLAKHIRKKMLAGEIQNDEDLDKNIRDEVNSYDTKSIGVKMFMSKQLIETLSGFLTDLDKENNNSFRGYDDLDQYYTLSRTINKIMFEIVSNRLLNK